MNLWWMLKSLITFVFMIGWTINLLISFNGSIFLPVIFIQNILFVAWKDILACQTSVSEDLVITVCHTVLRYSLLKMMAEIKYNLLGKGQMANNCIWPLSKNAHSQLPLITSSYIFPGGLKKALACSMQHWPWTDALRTNTVCSLAVNPSPDSYSSLTKFVIITTCHTSNFYPNSLLHSRFDMICSRNTQVLLENRLEKWYLI